MDHLRGLDLAWPGLCGCSESSWMETDVFLCVRVVVVRWVRSEEPSAGSQGGKGLAQDVFVF